MALADELDNLANWIQRLPRIGMETIGGAGASMRVLDFVFVGAIKRSLSLSSGLQAMVQAQNMICARAILRMQLDTDSRLLAYTYVKDPETMAREVIGGAALKKFKSTEGKPLVDSYLVDRMSVDYPWVRGVYNYTSGYVHFSEKQFFDSISSMGSDDQRTFQLQVSHVDSKFPESSWEEVVACFNDLLDILNGVFSAYATSKTSNVQ